MNKIFEEMQNIGWHSSYTNKELLQADYNNLQEFYYEYVENTNEELKTKKTISEYIIDNDVMSSIGFILDFVRAVKHIEEKEVEE